jgi:hypothetical protein
VDLEGRDDVQRDRQAASGAHAIAGVKWTRLRTSWVRCAEVAALSAKGFASEAAALVDVNVQYVLRLLAKR